MKVVAAGTGPAQGFPVAGCPCASCRQGLRDGIHLAPARLRIETSAGTHLTLTGTELPASPTPGLDLVELDAAEARAVIVSDDGQPGTGVLWAPASGEIAATALRALPSGSISLALLGPGADGDLTGCARSLAALRQTGVLAPGAPAALVAPTHDSARAARRALLLEAWGLPEVFEGQHWVLPHGSPELPEPAEPSELPGRVLVIGGSASGKSQLAEDLLAASGQVSYLATGQLADAAADQDWARRVQRHRDRRPPEWQTVETGDPAQPLRDVGHPVLLDSLGSWLTGVLDRAGAWQQTTGWRDQVDAKTRALVAAWSARPGAAVAVTEEVGWGVVPATPSGRLFADLLGQLNQAVAEASDQVIVVVAGQLLGPLPGTAPQLRVTGHDGPRG